MPQFTQVYYDMSQGEGNARGPWNSDEHFNVVSDRSQQVGVDGKDGSFDVQLTPTETRIAQQLMSRTRSVQAGDPITGAELGSDGTAPQSPAGSQPPKSPQQG
jgi:Mn-containing catalase